MAVNTTNGQTYTNIFHSEALQKWTQIGIFGMKINHLATLVAPESVFIDR
jgi:hypothetical protein